jgi:D-sedoheptulose 7-phosphate isomerase
MSDTTIDQVWFSGYLNRYQRALFEVVPVDELLEIRNRILSVRERGGKLLIVGNGGSAAIADHCAVDFTKNAGVRTLSFAGAAWVSCLANDFGYDEWVARSLEMHADDGDLVILISSSGASQNMITAARRAQDLGLYRVTLSGFDPDNPLRALGDLNLWVDSRAYNIVEMTHQIWLLAVCDAIIGKAEYPASKPDGLRSRP